jgi:hypothetical protein
MIVTEWKESAMESVATTAERSENLQEFERESATSLCRNGVTLPFRFDTVYCA